MNKLLLFALGVLLAGCARLPQPNSLSASDADAGFDRLAREHMTGYLQWRPQIGTALGVHEYDGTVTDLSRTSLDAQLARLKSIDQRFLTYGAKLLKKRASNEYGIQLS